VGKARHITLMLLLLAGAGFDRSGAALPAEPPSLEAAWSDLLGSDDGESQKALLLLASDPSATIAFLEKHLKPVHVDAKRIEQLIGNLDSKRFAERQEATRQLEAIGAFAKPQLRAALETKPSLEVCRRLEQLLERSDSWFYRRDAVRAVRAIAVLEHIGTPQARQMIQAMAGGHAKARSTQEAKAALALLAERPAPSSLEQRRKELGSVHPEIAARAFLSLVGPQPKASLAGPEEVRRILALTAQLRPAPLLGPAETSAPLPDAFAPPFLKAVLALYKDDGTETPLRVAVQEAVTDLIRSERELKREQIVRTIPKAGLAGLQTRTGTIQLQLAEELVQLTKTAEELEQVMQDPPAGPLLWKANATYVLACLHFRQAALLEYSCALGKVRRGDLAADTVWKLTPKPHPNDLNDFDSKRLVRKARGALEQLTMEHPFTPWETLGKRGIEISLGLDWHYIED
jgi:hypothetical protein